MPDFLHLSSPFEAWKILLKELPDKTPKIESVETSNALGRVLAEDIHAPHPLPEFTRSAMDGYAVRASDTYGASESNPGYLSLLGEVSMGSTPEFAVTEGTCALIHTGGMLPKGANAVIMLEFTQCVHSVPMADTTKSQQKPGEIEISRPVGEGENVLHMGEDVAEGQLVLKKGLRLRPAEIGGCMALGITKLRVAKKPRVTILSSGDEVIPPEENPKPGQVRDINSYSLGALVTQAGGESFLFGIIPDDLDSMKIAAGKAIQSSDLMIITAGSSVSERDATAAAIASLGQPGILVHGINIRPGKPTILAVCDGKAVIGLPGNPVSALVIAGLFVVPLINILAGCVTSLHRNCIRAKLTINLASQTGREDWIAVKLIDAGRADQGEVTYLADPVFGKSNLIFSLCAADGLVCIPQDANGKQAGELVDVILI